MTIPHEKKHIARLPENIINQIRAGEVIERPYHVVKELLENSIDAGAKTIQLEILDGGKQLIRVTDDGVGIAACEMSLALERHATSKITEFSDLEALSTLGFRGEALPSIASVSHVSISSCTQDQKHGFEISVDCGKKISEREIPFFVGTVVQVKNLFSGVPVRLKFLKSTATEFSHIYDFMTSLALAHFQIAFVFSHNGREVFRYQAKSGREERFAEVVGIEIKDFLPIHFKRGSFSLTGFVGLPEAAKATPAKYFVTFINDRYVKDKTIRSGLMRGYQGLLLKGLQPPAIIFIQVDPKWLDVNVHPSKTEIRFYDSLAVEELVSMAVQGCVKDHVQKKVMREVEKTSSSHASIPLLSLPTVLPHKKSYDHVANLKTERNDFLNKQHQYLQESQIKDPLPAKLFYGSPQKTPNSSLPFTEARYLGQFANCYLLLEMDSELWCVDQHAFHERILFEEQLLAHTQKNIPKQDLLTPAVLSFHTLAVSLVMERQEELLSLGFSLQRKGEETLEVHSHPHFLSADKVIPVFEEIVARLSQETECLTKSLKSADVFHLFFATIACHSAVRAGDALNEELVKRLLNRAGDVDFYAHCPHGRPVVRKFTQRDVESWFQRI